MERGNDQTTPFNAHSRQSKRDYKKKPSAKERAHCVRRRDAEWLKMISDINKAHVL